MGWMRYTCKQAAELMSLRRDEPLGFWREAGLKLHWRLCGNCRQVDKQLDQLGDLSAGLWGGRPNDRGDRTDQR
jgi:hypothetical protein